MSRRNQKNLCVVWNVGRQRLRLNPDKSELSEDKLAILDRIVDALVNRGGERPVLVLAGAAGTGKTTLMRVVIDELAKRGVASVLSAPTGKAAVRLKEVTGLPTMTVHRLIFTNPTNAGICSQCGQPSEALGISEGRARREGIRSVACPTCGRKYSIAELNKLENTILFAPRVPGPGDAPMVVIIDEASMVSKTLDKRIRENLSPRYGILYVGDKEQLPPVGKGEDAEWGPDWANAAGTLTTVHRQAAGNPIIDLATRIRENKNRIAPFRFTDPDAALPLEQRRLRVHTNVPLAAAAKWLATGRRMNVDATLIAWTNKTRVALNKIVRAELGRIRRDIPITAGDRLIILNNNPGADMANGEIFTVESVRWPASQGLREYNVVFVTLREKPGKEFLVPYDYLNAEDPSAAKRDFLDLYKHLTQGWERISRMIRMGPGKFDEDDWDMLSRADEMSADELFDAFQTVRPEHLIMADFGECITAHKSQGSQWDTVGIIWDYLPEKLWYSENDADYESARRWLYTAVTRAQRKLVVMKA